MADRPWMILVGARKRLGRFLAEDLARDHRLVLTGSGPWEGDADWIKELPVEAETRLCQWDAHAPDLQEQMMAEMQALRGLDVRLAGAVLLAGAFPEQPMGTWKADELEALWRLNLTFPLLAVQALLPLMAHGGCIHLILDTCIHRPFQRRIPYSLSKSGLAALVPALARQAAPNVRVVGHALGTLLPDEGSDEGQLALGTLLRRVGAPEDLARAVRYAQESRHLTGDILTLDGGWRWR